MMPATSPILAEIPSGLTLRTNVQRLLRNFILGKRRRAEQLFSTKTCRRAEASISHNWKTRSQPSMVPTISSLSPRQLTFLPSA
jgi:hypothetical protein